MKAEEYYKKIKPQLGTQALLSLQIDGNRLYGKDAICKMLEDYHKEKQREILIPLGYYSYDNDLENKMQPISKDVDEFLKTKTNDDLYDNMQYYLEFCQINGYVTPKEWLSKHKHF